MSTPVPPVHFSPEPMNERQDPSGNDRAARAAAGGREWGSMEVFLALMLAAAPFLAVTLVTTTALFVPALGPTVQVRDIFCAWDIH